MRPRTPEPMVMDDAEAVAAFDAVDPVLQLPIYRLNALAMSALVPTGGAVLDLGSGSGRLLAELARGRPDVRVVGTDLAPVMLLAGRAALADAGFDGRVELRHADMTALDGDLPDPLHLVSCVWALHHLPGRAEALACLRGMAEVRERTGCAVWLFDFARLEHPGPFEAVLALAAAAPDRLLDDARASEAAAWSPGELRQLLAEAGLGDLAGGAEQWIGHLQAYFSPAADGGAPPWCGPPLPPPSDAVMDRIRAGMPALPPGA
jgi:ubiquinone/menaquinone biosynthesis C-methylase UbiE